MVEIPTVDPSLGDVTFSNTAKYHWPQMSQNLSLADGDGFTETNGPPPTFKKAVELNNFEAATEEEKQVIKIYRAYII